MGIRYFLCIVMGLILGVLPTVGAAQTAEEFDAKLQSAEAHYNLALALAAQGKFDESIAQFREVVRISPQSAPAHSNLGVALERQDKLDDAVAEHREAVPVQTIPASTTIWLLLYPQGKLDEAILELRETLRLDASNADAHNNLGNALSDQWLKPVAPLREE